MTFRRHLFRADEIGGFEKNAAGTPIKCPEVPSDGKGPINYYDIEYEDRVYCYTQERQLYLSYPLGGNTDYKGLIFKTNRNALTYLWDATAYPRFDEDGKMDADILKQWRVNAHLNTGAAPYHRKALEDEKARAGVAIWYRTNGDVGLTATIGTLAEIHYGTGDVRRSHFSGPDSTA